MKSSLQSRFRSLVGGALALCLATSAHSGNVVEELSERPEFSTLVTAVTEAGLVDALANLEDVTIFAPDNAAFAAIPEADLAALLENQSALQDLLFYHVAPERIPYRSLSSGPLDTLLEGESVEIEVNSFFFGWFRIVEVDEARITRANIGASNGVIHRINSVLDPGFEPLPSILEIAAGDPNFSILASLVTQAGFAKALGNEYANLTVFAPTNAAFEALGAETLDAVQGDLSLLRTILKNHIALGSLDSTTLVAAGSVDTVLGLELELAADPSAPTGFSIDGKPIEVVDIEASNGVVHVIGGVLVPPAPQSLVDVALTRAELSTLVTAVTEAGLVPTFDRTEKWPAYTIFAPNNAAFDALPDGVLASLLADPTGALVEVLQLHVVPGRLEAEDLYDGQVLHTLSGDRLTVSISDGAVGVNNATVVEPDLKAENGVIHIIDAVLAKETFTVADFVASKSYLSTLQAAVAAAGLGGALDDPDAELTLFAPLDYAFSRLPEGTLDTLLEDPAGDLTQILLYHVVGESLRSGQLVDDGSATTLQGQDVTITARTYSFWGWRFPYSIVSVNGNRIIAANLETDNGIVHLITGVLLPPASE